MNYLLIPIVIAVVWSIFVGPAVGCALIARVKNRNQYAWFFIGLLGWLALLGAAIMQPKGAVEVDGRYEVPPTTQPMAGVYGLIGGSLVVVGAAVVIQQLSMG